ncbi:MAG TPA: hypothetical protein DCG88_02535, partial [Sphingobacterium sp.]|nr:hypothetical protein [Sphingobacterium sp.]
PGRQTTIGLETKSTVRPNVPKAGKRILMVRIKPSELLGILPPRIRFLLFLIFFIFVDLTGDQQGYESPIKYHLA